MGNQKTIKEKLKKYNIDENRFLFLGQVKAHIYGWVIDLYLTPFKLGGQALEEYRNKIKSYVALHEQDWYQDMLKLEKQNKIPKKNELYTGEYLERLKEKGYLIEENKFAKTFLDIVHPLNKEDYLKIALKLLQDKELKDMILAEYEYVKQIDDKKNDINMIKQFLKVVDD
jgi:disulfide oxidoreductase YuzD